MLNDKSSSGQIKVHQEWLGQDFNFGGWILSSDRILAAVPEVHYRDFPLLDIEANFLPPLLDLIFDFTCNKKLPLLLPLFQVSIY